MKTEVLKIDPEKIDIEALKYAAAVIREGGLVAFPTETVYGLGANAFSEAAVNRIYEAKGRPPDNPLIVHISSTESLADVASHIPECASRLMARFWPGPLTLIFKKSALIPGVTTAGLDTVAVRMPSHPVALALIGEARLPIAAPSANLSGRPSPTLAQHVIDDLYGKVELIIDSGPCLVGLESTVLDITTNPPVILRPGGVVPSQLEEVLGQVAIGQAFMPGAQNQDKPRSPGMKYRHYSPRAKVLVVQGSLDRVVDYINRAAAENIKKGVSVGILATEQTRTSYLAGEVIPAGDRDKPETIASHLFQCLREFDRIGVGLILAEAVENSGIGLAVMNRMAKAAGYNIIKV